jgi:cytochrome oxidase Cu insertion factor (SCO1/SenC/PrrC family)
VKRSLPDSLLDAPAVKRYQAEVMRTAVALLAVLASLATASCSSKDAGTTASAKPETSAAPAKVLVKGDAAPPFRLVGSDGKEHTLAEHLGKEAVVVAWFPKAFTGG